jgi:hypothetical protein
MWIGRLREGGVRGATFVLDGGHGRTENDAFERLWTFVGSDVFLERDPFAEFGVEEVAFVEKEDEVDFFEERGRADVCEDNQNGSGISGMAEAKQSKCALFQRFSVSWTRFTVGSSTRY